MLFWLLLPAFNRAKARKVASSGHSKRPLFKLGGGSSVNLNTLLEMALLSAQVDHNDPEHKKLKAFNDLWTSHFAKDSLLIFSTGRSHPLFIELRV